ncbi:ParB-like partition protein [Opitutaceae bacterium TAV1]|nr:ParB-like partition protein [Opitutaceae bacterium TAV1]
MKNDTEDMTTEPAFGGLASGTIVDFPTREDAQEHIDEQQKRAGADAYSADIRKRGNVFDIHYKKTEAAPAAELPIFNWQDGICLNPEVIAVPMPKGCGAAFWVAQAPEGRWARRALFRRGNDVSDTHATVGALDDRGVLVSSRPVALSGGLQLAGQYFKGHKAAGKALEAFRTKLEEGGAACSPANSGDGPPAAAAAAPGAKPEARVYRAAFFEIPVAKIQANPKNHRKFFDPVEMRELADSIALEGLHQPIGVRRLLPDEQPEGELALGDVGAPEFELIYGERRKRALEIAGIDRVMAKVYEGLHREQTHAIALIENLQRAGINAMEEADGYAELMTAENLTQEECAARVGKERSTVANVLRLRTLPAKVREFIGEGKLTKAHGIALARFVPAEKDRDAVPKWEMIVNAMAEEAVEKRTPAGAMEKGVPSLYSLAQAGLLKRISPWNGEKVTDKLKKHPAYFAVGDGEWACFDPAHWENELAARAEQREKREAAEAAKRQAELAKAAKSGRKQIRLEDLDSKAYRNFSDDDAALNDLVPEEKRAVAKQGNRNVTIVTDAELADRIKAAFQRGVKKDRKARCGELAELVKTKVGSMRKMTGREWGWLVYQIVDFEGRSVQLSMDADAAQAADVVLPAGAADTVDDPDDDDGKLSWNESMARKRERRLNALAKTAPVDLVRALIMERLPKAMTEIIEGGAGSTGGRYVRWWLEVDTLGLAEETDEGRAKLVDRVRAAPWYGKAVAGEAPGGDEGEE